MSRRKTVSIDELPPGIIALNPQLALQNGAGAKYTPSPISTHGERDKIEQRGVSTKERRIQERRMNKTEERFFDLLKNDIYADERDTVLIVPQPTRFFRFPNGDTYTPDFLVIHQCGVTVYEVKGGYKGHGAEQGYERFHRAAEKFGRHGITFILATWDRERDEWVYEIG